MWNPFFGEIKRVRERALSLTIFLPMAANSTIPKGYSVAQKRKSC
jgi:hypothetical protein